MAGDLVPLGPEFVERPTRPPEGWVELAGDAVMSNFDHQTDEGQADRLRDGGCWSRHAGQEFNGRVWFEQGEWHEQVWRYGSPAESFSAATLEELMHAVNDIWGWE